MKKIFGAYFCSRWAQKAVGGGGGGGGAQNKVPDLFFFFFFLGTQKILGGGKVLSLSGGAPTGNVTPLSSRVSKKVGHVNC